MIVILWSEIQESGTCGGGFRVAVVGLSEEPGLQQKVKLLPIDMVRLLAERIGTDRNSSNFTQ
jgi:hypothetical protein